MANTFYIVRHGQTNWNILGKTQGHGNSDLTQKGEEQAFELAKAIKEYPIDYIYSSDLGRAVQTAETVSYTHLLIYNLDTFIAERPLGASTTSNDTSSPSCKSLSCPF